MENREKSKEIVFLHDYKIKVAWGKTIVFFWTPWCRNCPLVSSQLDTAITQAATKIPYYKVDADYASDIATFAKVQMIPTTLFIEDGEVQHAVTGTNIAQFKSTFNDFLNAPPKTRKPPVYTLFPSYSKQFKRD